MVKYENRCCKCATGGYPCQGALCPRRNAEVHYCDKCGAELDGYYEHGYELDGAEYCRHCYEEITGEEI